MKNLAAKQALINQSVKIQVLVLPELQIALYLNALMVYSVALVQFLIALLKKNSIANLAPMILYVTTTLPLMKELQNVFLLLLVHHHLAVLLHHPQVVHSVQVAHTALVV